MLKADAPKAKRKLIAKEGGVMDGRELRKRFREFNQQYFAGGLPNYSIRVVEHMTALGESGRILRFRKLIQIQRGFDEKELVSTLLHEMAHAATVDNHGNRWKAEMIRLRDAGAPLYGSDLNVDPDDWSEAHFSGVVGASTKRSVRAKVGSAVNRESRPGEISGEKYFLVQIKGRMKVHITSSKEAGGIAKPSLRTLCNLAYEQHQRTSSRKAIEFKGDECPKCVEIYGQLAQASQHPKA